MAGPSDLRRGVDSRRMGTHIRDIEAERPCSMLEGIDENIQESLLMGQVHRFRGRLQIRIHA